MVADPITLEVLRNAFQSVAEEMGVTLTRTALSPNIKDRRDCSTAVYNAKGELVSQAEHIPLHLGLMPTVVKSLINYFKIENLLPGDALLINDPYISGSHLPDICVVSPVYIEDRLVAIAANLAHHVDVGGAAAGSMSTSATDIFQEGIRIPPVKICKEGKIDEELIGIVANNVRTREEFYGDIQAQISANQIGIQRLKELSDRVGLDVFEHYMEEIINYAELRMRKAVQELPSGIFSFTDYLEGDGISEERIAITAEVEIGEDSIKVDFSGTSPQVKGPVNATRGVTLACVFFAVKAAADPDLPSSEGISRAIEVVTPEGTLVNPVFPAAVAHANINTAQRITDVVLGALSKIVPEKVCAAGTGSMSNFTIGGKDVSNKHYSYVETYGGGQGAKSDQDGMDGVHVNMTNTFNTPAEVIEINYPLIVEKYGLITDSGGPGKFRGGSGITRIVKLLCDSIAAVSTERSEISPWGLDGGCPGKRAICFVKFPGMAYKKMPGKFTRELPAGTEIILETAGGGGFGNPFERSEKAVRIDVVDGLVSKKAALENYGVVLKEDFSIDYKKTKFARENAGRF